jgi:hypothetical protein
MSNYDDQANCPSCSTHTKYSELKNLADYDCGPACIDRNNSERSVMDKMMYDHFVLGKPLNVPLYDSNGKKPEPTAQRVIGSFPW